MSAMAPNTARCLRIARLAYFASIVLIILWQFIGNDLGYSVGFLALSLVPLFLPAVGLLQGKPYTHAWSGFIACLYLLWASTSWWTHADERLIATLVMVSLMTWLTASTYFARFRGRELGLGLKNHKDEEEP